MHEKVRKPLKSHPVSFTYRLSQVIQSWLMAICIMVLAPVPRKPKYIHAQVRLPSRVKVKFKRPSRLFRVYYQIFEVIDGCPGQISPEENNPAGEISRETNFTDWEGGLVPDSTGPGQWWLGILE